MRRKNDKKVEGVLGKRMSDFVNETFKKEVDK